jgi:hypothetical protein
MLVPAAEPPLDEPLAAALDDELLLEPHAAASMVTETALTALRPSRVSREYFMALLD